MDATKCRVNIGQVPRSPITILRFLEAISIWRYSKLLPFVSAHAGLPQEPSDETRAEIALMRVGDPQCYVSFPHDLVLAPGKRAAETQAT